MSKKRKSIITMAVLSLSLMGALTASAYSVSHSSWPTVKYGSSGGFVGALQADLWSSGYQSTVGTVDRSFGVGTTSAVISFQTKQGLTADGTVGNGTWKKFDNYVVNDGPNTWFYRNSGSSTYQTYYLLLSGSSTDTLQYYLEYRSNRNSVASGNVYSE